MVPTRGPVGPAYDPTEYATVPGPVPLCPDEIVSHDESLAVVQGHPGSDGITVKEPVPPAAGKLPPSGLSTKLQVAPLCVTVRSANPPFHETRIAPVRVAMVVLALAVHEIAAELLPDVAPSAIHGVDVEAAHGQATGLVAMTLNVPPAAGTFCDVTDNVNAQSGDRAITKSRRESAMSVNALSWL